MNEEPVKRKKIWLWAGIAAAAAIILVIVLTVTGQKGYRIIQVYDLNGTATIEREGIGALDAYVRLLLKTGDLVRVHDESTMRLRLDEDKYLFAEENTVMAVHATGSSRNSKTDIELQQGAVTVEIENKLSKNSSCQVASPNAVMSVRGTIFRGTVEKDANGDPLTRLFVFEGSVEIRKINDDGTMGEAVIVDKGREVIVRREGEEIVVILPEDIIYEELPDSVLELLGELVQSGNNPGLEEEKIRQALESRGGAENENGKEEGASSEEDQAQTHTVTFLYKGSVFGTQTVKDGETAAVPVLKPAGAGDWDYDFSRPVKEDITIKFR